MILQPVLDQSEVVLKSRVFHVILRLVLDQSQGGPKLVPKSCVFHMILHHTMDHLTGPKLVPKGHVFHMILQVLDPSEITSHLLDLFIV